MKKSFALVLFTFFLFFSNAIGQSKDYTSVKKAIEISSRPLKVVLQKGKSKTTEAFNQNFKEAVLSEWKMSDDIQFITNKEYKEEKKNSKYAYLKISKNFKRNAFGNNAGITSVDESLYYFSLDISKPVTRVSFEFSKKDHKAKYFVQIQRLNQSLLARISTKKNEPSFYELYKRKNKTALNKYLEKHAIEAKAILKTKILLIDRALINKKLDSKIKTYYPFEYKIVSEEEINKAILANDSSKVILSKDNITNADTGKLILSFFMKRDTTMKTKIAPFGIGLGVKLKEKNLINLGSYLN